MIRSVLLGSVLLGSLLAAPLAAQEPDAEATIAALQTQVAELGGNPASPTAEAKPTESPELESVNIQLIFDVSGSMAQTIPTGETRMEAAKRVLTDVVAGIPNREGINVGLRIYGHEGNNTELGAEVSCASSDLIVPMEGVEKNDLDDAIADLQPTGWTPIGLSLERAGTDFEESGSSSLNYIVLITDGLETCGGDPVGVARELRRGDTEVTTSVIGFGLTPDEQATIAGIAQAGGGDVIGASDATELSDALFTVLSTPVPDIVTPTPAPVSAEAGTRENPLPIGTSAEIGGGWVASVVDVVPDATDLIQIENQFNEPPPPGKQFFLVTIAARYEGEESSTLPAGNAFQVVGERGVAYTSFDPSCGVIPNPFAYTEVFSGGTIEGDVCFVVDAAEVDSLVMFSEDYVTFDRDIRVWFALS